MASPAEAPRNGQPTAVADVDVADQPQMPQEAPPLTNPPATLDELDQADRARAAVGGEAAAAQPRRQEPAGASGEWSTEFRRTTGPIKARRFAPPEEVEFEFTPPEPQRIRNNNLPLTIGLLLSIVAAFVVFIVSLSGTTGGPDPIMAAFWRALGALAVLTTLSFAVSWFMPTPPDRRQLLDQLDAEDRAMGRYRAPEPVIATAGIDEEPDFGIEAESLYDDEEGVGGSVDVTLDDDEAYDDIDSFLARTEDDDVLDDEEDESLAAPSPSPIAAANPPAEAEE
jgi:hypothetical protein